MVVASTSLIIPAALKLAQGHLASEVWFSRILTLSLGTAIILLILYGLDLYFGLKTHARLFEATQEESDEKGWEVEPTKTLTSNAVITLLGLSVLIAICGENIVDSIDEVVETLHIHKTFISLILTPLLGNAAEYVSAIHAAYKGKMSLSIKVAIPNSLQIALFVIPALVIVGWIIEQLMNLAFEPFGAVVFFLSVIVVERLVADDDSNYLEGVMLVGT
jgi:Ca2+:H+ antiporter